jgi:hypothetical protein
VTKNTTGRHVAAPLTLLGRFRAAIARAKRRAEESNAQYEAWASTETEFDYAW